MGSGVTSAEAEAPVYEGIKTSSPITDEARKAMTAKLASGRRAEERRCILFIDERVL